MSLTPRDFAAALVAVLSVLVYVGNAQDVWYLGSNRWAIGTMAVIGVVGCSLGRIDSRAALWAVPLSILGIAALAIAVAGLVTGSHALLVALLAVQLALWAGATLRHATTGPPHAAAPA